MTNVAPYVEFVSWLDISAQVKLVNAELANIIDSIPQSSDTPLIKARYYYGARIINKGVLTLPISSNQAIPLSDNRLPASINTALSYGNFPVGLILTKATEIFFDTNERSIPLNILDVGGMFGMSAAISLVMNRTVKRAWNMTAGARTVFSLAKLSNKTCHLRLQQEFGVAFEAPHSLFEHHSVFSDIAKRASPWCCEILLFTRQWLEDKRFTVLHDFWRQKVAYKLFQNYQSFLSKELVWDRFVSRLGKHNLGQRPVAISATRHLLAISENISYGFAVSHSEEFLPLSLLQRSYAEIYRLTEYPLIIMRPQILQTAEVPLYYSLSLPTSLEMPLMTNAKVRIINDLLDVKKLVDLFQSTVCQYEFFHCVLDSLQTLKPVEVLPELDPQFMSRYLGKGLTFPYSSPFFKGCIQVVKKSR